MSTSRERLPNDRQSITRSFRLRYQHTDGRDDVMSFEFIVGLFPDGRPGEVFIRADKTGTLASGALDATAVMMSLLLQHGVPLETIVSKLKGIRFSPSGWTGDKDVPNCSSPLDLLAKWLEYKFAQPTTATPDITP